MMRGAPDLRLPPRCLFHKALFVLQPVLWYTPRDSDVMTCCVIDEMPMTNDIYIAGAIRTPIGTFGGSLAELSAVELGEIAARSALESAGVAPTEIAETLIGHGRQAGCGPNPARQIAVRAGVPESTPAMTVNQACASGLRTIALAVQAA
ncbi:MAG: hypothetical protein GF341_09625, partial [candidate division Zixibacteria bacterium]|nr:hypothetical protein [candidate division Zixibacteria bacterium]